MDYVSNYVCIFLVAAAVFFSALFIIYRYRRIKDYRLLDAGLARLEHMYNVANNERSPIDIDAVKVDDVTQCYMALRQLDSRAHGAPRKFIVLDLSTSYAVQTVLKQVIIIIIIIYVIVSYLQQWDRMSRPVGKQEGFVKSWSRFDVPDVGRNLVPDLWPANGEGALPELGTCPHDNSCVSCR